MRKANTVFAVKFFGISWRERKNAAQWSACHFRRANDHRALCGEAVPTRKTHELSDTTSPLGACAGCLTIIRAEEKK